MAKLALLIGVSEYEPGLSPLPAVAMDIQEIGRVLKYPEMGGFAANDVQTLLNPEPQKMQEAIEALFSDRQKEDLVLLYFSGHGIKDERGKLYLATRLTRKNTQGRIVKATAVPTSFVHNIMSESRSKRQVVILDCCFSGAFAEGWSAKDDGSVDIYTQLGGEGRVVLTSSTSTQYSFEQQGGNLSIYTHYLVEGIETGAADRDSDGVISVDELHDYAKKKVKEAAPAMQPEIYAVKEGFKIRLAKAPIGDPKLRYRQQVEIFASRGEISAIARTTLDLKKQDLGLSTEETTAIEAEVFKPYQEYRRRLQQYEQVLAKEIKIKYPLDENVYIDLKSFQEALGLKDEDVKPILVRVAPKEVPQKNLQEIKIKSKNSTNPTHHSLSIWNILTVVLGIFILGGVGTWVIGVTSIHILKQIDINNTPSEKTIPSPSPSPTTNTNSTTAASTNTEKRSKPGTVPSGIFPSITEHSNVSLLPFSRSDCLAYKQHWETRKRISGSDGESIRALMEEQDCKRWGVTLPKAQSKTSTQVNPQTETKSKLQSTPNIPSNSSSTINLPKQKLPQLPSTPNIPSNLPSLTNDSLGKTTNDTESKELCTQEKNRLTQLIKEGAVSEQFVQKSLAMKSCSKFGINYP